MDVVLGRESKPKFKQTAIPQWEDSRCGLSAEITWHIILHAVTVRRYIALTCAHRSATKEERIVVESGEKWLEAVSDRMKQEVTSSCV